jgi:phosphinothricin acetyltransferase
MNDEEFWSAFWNQSLTAAQFGHDGHVRFGWLLLQKYSDFESAMVQAKIGLHKLNAVLGGKIGYHETITRAYLLLILAAKHAGEPGSFIEFQAANQNLLGNKLAALKLYYSDANLWSPKAKETYCEPDLRRLPPAGVVRDATQNDAAAIIKIYEPYIRESGITFEVENPSLGEMQSRIAQHGKYGWFVYEVAGEIVGYAYASKHRERAAYQWCCEVSAYLSEEWHGRGIATILYRRLCAVLRRRGLVNAYAGITLPNPKSVAFHEAFGFKLIGVYEKIGFKLGRWHDVGWWGLRLSEPAKVQPIF